MVKAKKTQVSMLTAFIKDKIRVTTTLMSAIELPDGNIVEAPIVVEGILLDHDENFILLGQQNDDALELVAIGTIAFMRQVLVEEEVMSDSLKPAKDKMS